MLKSYTVLMSLVVTSVMGALTGPAVAARNDVLVVPDRQRMVALAFDVQSLRQSVLVTFRGNASSATPLLHVWNPRGKAWSRLSQEDFLLGRFMTAQPGNVYLFGADGDIPPSILEGASRGRNLVRIKSFNIAEAANTLDKTMKFSTREWTTLSSRHGLQTQDLNADKRKWGRYGPPGARLEPPRQAPETTASMDVVAEEIPEAAAEPSADTAPVEKAAEPPIMDAAPVEKAAEPPVKQISEPAETVPAFIPDASVSMPLDPDEIPAPAVARPEDK